MHIAYEAMTMPGLLTFIGMQKEFRLYKEVLLYNPPKCFEICYISDPEDGRAKQSTNKNKEVGKY